MLVTKNTILNIIDVQGKLAQMMYDRDRLFENLQRLIKGVKVLGIPILWAEQIPDKLGSTIPEVKTLLVELQPIIKTSFSCWGNETYRKKLQSLKKSQVLVAGIEAHVCVYQTVMDLLNMEYDVHVIADAVSSRTLENKQIGLAKMQSLGAKISSVETALFELLRVAEGEAFKEIVKIVK